MKAYVIPIEKSCNAKCPYCITHFKNDIDFGDILDPINLLRLGIFSNEKGKSSLDKIEITGGGEPFLHPEIDSIIAASKVLAPTQIYTNGSMLSKCKVLHKLSYLCISRAHYEDAKNKEIMGIEPDVDFRDLDVPIKFSLVLCKSGINTASEITRYLDWALLHGASKVVIRQLFDCEPTITTSPYSDLINKEYIGTATLIEDLGITNSHRINDMGNVIFHFADMDRNIMEVEMERRACACELFNPVLRANGKVYVGWSDKLW